MKRRSFIAGSAVALACPALAAAPPKIRVALLGQSLIEHDLSPALWPSRAQMAAYLNAFDVSFTNFETVILGPHAQLPTREALTLHTAKPEVFETLKALKINLLATSNNHAFDLGSGGISDTVAALSAAKLAFAGSGLNLQQATAPGVIKTPVGSVALVAFATGKVREGGAATNNRPGVNEMRRTAAGTPVEEDAHRILAAIAEARKSAPVVIAYQHNHDWEPVEVNVPAWQRAFARKCVDAGAAVFVGHGVPMLQGVETYKGAPLLFGLGNFVFQTEKAVGDYGPECWESVIADCEFAGGKCLSVKFTPITLNEVGLKGPKDMESRGTPSLASPPEAARILAHLAELSKPFDTQFLPRTGSAPLQLSL